MNLNPYCSDTPYQERHGGSVKGCGSALVIVPDADGKTQTICCPRCDKVNWWPRLMKTAPDATNA